MIVCRLYGQRLFMTDFSLQGENLNLIDGMNSNIRLDKERYVPQNKIYKGQSSTQFPQDVSSIKHDSLLDTLMELRRVKVKFRELESQHQIVLRRLITESLDNLSDVQSLVTIVELLLFIEFRVQGEAFKTKLIKAMLSNLDIIPQNDFVTLFHGLSKLGIVMQDLSSTQSESLFIYLDETVLSLGGRKLSTLVWSLGKSGLSWNSLPEGILTKIFNRIAHVGVFGQIQLSSLVVGLSKLDLKWRMIPRRVRQILLKNFPDPSQCQERAYSNIIDILGTLEVHQEDIRRYDLSMNEQDQFTRKIFDGYVNLYRNFTSQGLSTTISGLSKLGFTTFNIPKRVMTCMQLSCLEKNIEYDVDNPSMIRMNDQAFSNILFHFGKMNFVWNSDAPLERMLVPAFRSACLKQFENHLTVMTEQGLSNTLNGFAKLGLKFDNFPLSTRTKLLAHVITLEETLIPRSISNILWAFHKFDLNWDKLGEKLQITLLRSIEREIDDFNGEGVSITIYALSHLLSNNEGCKVDDKSLNVIKALLQRITTLTHKLQPIEVANIVYGLAKLDLNVNDLDITVKNSLISSVRNTISSMSEQEFGNTVWGLFGKLGFDFNTLSVSVSNAMAKMQHVIKHQALFAVLQSLSQSGVVWDDFSDEMRNVLWLCTLRVLPTPVQNGILVLKGRALSEYFKGLTIALQCLSTLRMPLDASKEKELLDKRLFPILTEFKMKSSAISSGVSIGYGITGFAKLKRSWSSLSDEQKIFLTNYVDDYLIEAMNSRDFTGLLWMYGQLSADFRYLDNSLKTLVIRKFEEAISHMNSTEIAWSLWSLGRIKIIASDISKTGQEVLIRQLSLNLQDMNRQESAVTLWGLGELKFPVNELSDDLRYALTTILVYWGK